MNRYLPAMMIMAVLFAGGCAEPPAKIVETPTSKVLDRLTDAKARFRALSDVKQEQMLKKMDLQKNYFTPLDLEKTGKNMEGALTPDAVDKMNKLLDEADKEMDKFPK